MWVSLLFFVVFLSTSLKPTLSQKPQNDRNCELTDCEPLPIDQPWCPSDQVPSISPREEDLGVLMLCCKCMDRASENVKPNLRRSPSSDRLKIAQNRPRRNETVHGQNPQNVTQLRILDSAGQNDIEQDAFNDNEANRHEFPYIVSLQINGVHKCGGSIIDELHVLTAAHCFSRRDAITRSVTGLNFNVTGVQIVAGEHVLYQTEGSEQVVQVSEIEVHPNYNARSYQQGYDIAVLTLTNCLRFRPNVVQPADFLPLDLSLDYEIRALSRSRTSTIAGWGGIGVVDDRGREIASNVLLTTSLNVQRCTDGYFRGVPNSVVCALGENELGMTTDACQGDSGGPIECLIDNGRIKYVCGIVSYGEVCPVHDGTAGVYTRISYYRRWIRRVLVEDYDTNGEKNC